MNWINSVVRPKIRSILRKKDMPDNLWVKCPETGQMIYYKDLEANQFVFPNSGYHQRMDARTRFRRTNLEEGRLRERAAIRGRGRCHGVVSRRSLASRPPTRSCGTPPRTRR